MRANSLEEQMASLTAEDVEAERFGTDLHAEVMERMGRREGVRIVTTHGVEVVTEGAAEAMRAKREEHAADLAEFALVMAELDTEFRIIEEELENSKRAHRMWLKRISMGGRNNRRKVDGWLEPFTTK